MVFRRRRRTYRRRSSKKVNPSVKRYVKKQIDRAVEDRQLVADMSSAFSSIGSSWIEADMTGLAQGAGSGQRIGTQLTVKSFQMIGTLVGGQTNVAADDKYNVVRIVLAMWDGTSATPLTSNSANISSYIVSDAPAGRGLRKKYIDRYVTLPSPGRDSTGYMPPVRVVKLFKKLNKIIKYYSTTAASAEQKLVLSMISDSVLIPNPGFVNGRYVMRYQDC